MVQYAEGPSIGTTEAVAVGAMLRQEVEVVQVEAETNLEMTGRVGWMADVVGDIPAMTATDPVAMMALEVWERWRRRRTWWSWWWGR